MNRIRMTGYLLLFAVLSPAWAQQTPEYSVGYVMAPENNYTPLASGGRLSYPAIGVNRNLTATVIVANRGPVRGAVNSIGVSGTGFVLTGAPALPAVLDPGRELRIGVVFAPRQSGSFTGFLSFTFSEGAAFRAELAAATAPADPALAYLFPSEGNLIPVISGATISFPATRVNNTGNAVISVGNRGLGGGSVTEISLTGKRFRLTGVAPLPVFLESGSELRLGLIFEARDIDLATAVLRITIDGRALVLNIEGRGVGSRFRYAVEGAVVSPNSKTALPETALGQSSALTVEVRNTGNAEGSIAGVSLSGEGFTLANLPFFPQTLPPEAGFSFQIGFAPKQPGPAAGRLRIGVDSFDLEASALGSQLTYSYRGSAGSVPIRDARNVLWAPVNLSQSATVDFLMRNTGNAPAKVSAVLVVDPRSAFKLSAAPQFPLTIDPGSEVALPIQFSPVSAGDHTARLYVDDEIFSLIGTGAPLPPLPTVEIRGPARTQGALQQRSIAVVLAQPYPLPLTGVLTLGINSGSLNVIDPAVQFSTGGRAAAFSIPAGQTQASFQGRPEVFFQTGSVSGTVNFQASFAVRGVNVTPDTPPSVEVLIPPSPPQVLDIQLEARAANGIAVVVTGLATTRTLDTLEIQFVSLPKFNLPVGKFTVDLASASAAWYRRRDSEAYGSLFTASIPFAMQSGAALNPDEVFQSVSATLINAMGRSNSLSTAPKP